MIFPSYPVLVSFGIFLLHNYGGQKLFGEILKNKYSNWDAIINGIYAVNNEKVTKSELLLRYMEAYVCKGSEYSEKMKTPLRITAQGKTMEVDGVDPFDLTVHGYFPESESGWEKKGLFMFPADKNGRMEDLRPEGGFHICDAGTAAEDTVTLVIERSDDINEKRYILISD